MAWLPARLLIKDVGGDRITRKGLKRERSNEFDGAVRHYYVHIASRLAKLASEIRGLVSSDRSGDSENDGHEGKEFKEFKEFGNVKSRRALQAKCNRKRI